MERNIFQMTNDEVTSHHWYNLFDKSVIRVLASLRSLAAIAEAKFRISLSRSYNYDYYYGIYC